MSKNKKSERFLNTFTISIVFLCLVAAFVLGCVSKNKELQADAGALDQQITALEQQLEDEKMKALESQVQQRYYESDGYKETVARNTFNLIRAGERLYIIQ